MPSDIKSATTEDLRMRNYRQQLQQHNDSEIRDLEQKHNEDIARLQDNFTNQVQNLRHAYEIEISEEAENLEEKLQKVRGENEEKKISTEKKAGEDEVVKNRTANQQRIDEYKKNSELQLDPASKTSASLHRRPSRKSQENRQERKRDLKSMKYPNEPQLDAAPETRNGEQPVAVDGFQQILDMLKIADPAFRESLLKRLAARDLKSRAQPAPRFRPLNDLGSRRNVNLGC